MYVSIQDMYVSIQDMYVSIQVDIQEEGRGVIVGGRGG